MSVINDMLRDLNQRRAPEVSEGHPGVPESLIEPQRNNLKTLGILLVFVLLVAVATAFWLATMRDELATGQAPLEEADRPVQSEMDTQPAESALNPESLEQQVPLQQKVSIVLPENVPPQISASRPATSEAAVNETAMTNPASKEVEITTVAVTSPVAIAPELSKAGQDPQENTQDDAVSEHLRDDRLAAEPETRADSPAILTRTVIAEPASYVADSSTSMKVSLSPLALDRQAAAQAANAFAQGDAEQAYRDLVGFIAQNEVDNESRAVLANYLLQENRLAEAGDLLLNAPVETSASLRQLKARWYAAQGDEKMALYTLNSVLPEIRQYPEYYVLLAAYYQRFGWHKEALRTYTALVEYDDSVADWWAGLALAADRTEDLRQALLAYQQALELPGLAPELSVFITNRVKQLRSAQKQG